MELVGGHMQMIKTLLAGATALVIASSTAALAQYRPDGAQRFQPSVEDLRAFAEARIAGLKAGLTLNADQEKNWPAFEQAARDFQKLRIDRLSAGIDARRSGQSRSANPADVMQQRATALAETSSALKKLADATGPLYASLDDSQKRRFGVLSRMGAGEGNFAGPMMRQPMMRGPMNREPMMHDGYGPRFRRTDDSTPPVLPNAGAVRPIASEEDL